MPGHLWPLPLPLPLAGFGEAAGDAAEEDVAVFAAECEFPVDVDALAIVTPRASAAPRAPAPMAVPMSGRVILTVISLRSSVRTALLRDRT
jgi:hypothetical protein